VAGFAGWIYLTYFRTHLDLSKWFLGRVVDEASRDRLAGAKVALEAGGVPPVLYSDSEGVFAFPVPTGVSTVRVRIESPGYEHYDRQVDVTSMNGVQEIRMKALPAGIPGKPPDHPLTVTASQTSPPQPVVSALWNDPRSVEGFTFALQRCTRKVPTVSCSFTVVSNQADRELTIQGRSRIIQSSGTEQLASTVSLAGRETRVDQYSSLSANLIRGVPMIGGVSFEGIDGDQPKAPVIELLFNGFNVQFRDVPFS
jgi:hypothetical protein